MTITVIKACVFLHSFVILKKLDRDCLSTFRKLEKTPKSIPSSLFPFQLLLKAHALLLLVQFMRILGFLVMNGHQILPLTTQTSEPP